MSTAAQTGWAGQSNGQIDLSKMAVVDGQHFEPHYAAQILVMKKAYHQSVGRELTIDEGYRRLGGRADPAGTLSQWGMWNRKVQNPNAPIAAVPGTSNHGLGLACDFSGDLDSWDSTGQAWFRANEARFGISTVQGLNSGEPWHKVCVAWLTASELAALGGSPIIPEEDLPLNAQDLAHITSIVNTAVAAALTTTKDGIRRDARARLYRNSDTGDYFMIDWRAPKGQRVAYIHAGPTQIAHLYSPYQYLGDSLANAVNINTATCKTLIGVAEGTDTIFSNPPSWVPAAV